jgi:NAD(P)-dependent dehydrogenase (short-subunit alcohol dehydrogenase family)
MAAGGRLEGRTVVLTGASSGIGRATALGLADEGARLFLVGRSPERCEETLAEIRRRTGRDDAVMLRADLSSQKEVRRLADELLGRADRIHVLLNNAGVTLLSRQTTVDGLEATFATNHLAYFLLTGLLLPRLRESAPARIVNVASDAHRFGRLDLGDLQNEHRYRAMRVYGQSKTANILFTQELARRIAGSGVTANALHPGGIRSNLGRSEGRALEAVRKLVGLFLKSPEEGARTSLYLACSPEVEGVSGRYFANCRERTPAAHARDPELARRLWERSEELTGLRYPEDVSTM